MIILSQNDFVFMPFKYVTIILPSQTFLIYVWLKS